MFDKIELLCLLSIITVILIGHSLDFYYDVTQLSINTEYSNLGGHNVVLR